MADLPFEGQAPKKTVSVEEKKVDGEAKQTNQGIQLNPTVHVQGNELVVLIQLLASMNKNLAAISMTLHRHFNPEEKKNG